MQCTRQARSGIGGDRGILAARVQGADSEHSIGRTCKRTAKSGSQRKVGFRCNLAVATRSSEGRLTQPKAGAQPWPRERVLMPHTRRSQHPSGPAQVGGKRSFAPTTSQRLEVRRIAAVPCYPIESAGPTQGGPLNDPAGGSPSGTISSAARVDGCFDDRTPQR
jgi:hypothetical protein